MALVLESGDKGAGIETARPRNRHLPNVTNHVVIEFSQGPGLASRVFIEVDVLTPLSEAEFDQIISSIRDIILPPRNDRVEGTTSPTESGFVVRWHNAVKRVRTFFRKGWKRLRSIRVNCFIVFPSD